MGKKLLVIGAAMMFVLISAPETKAEMKKEKMAVCVNALKGSGASKGLIDNVCKNYAKSRQKFLSPKVANFMGTWNEFMAYCKWVRDLLASGAIELGLTEKNLWDVGCTPAHLSDGQIRRHGRSYGN